MSQTCFDPNITFREEFKTVLTATKHILLSACSTVNKYSNQRDTAVCLLASSQQYQFDRCLLLCAQSWTPDDGRKDCPKHVESHSKIK